MSRLFLSRRGWIPSTWLLPLALISCTHLPREAPGRLPRPLNPEQISVLRPRHEGRALTLRCVERDASYDRFVFGFQAYDEFLGDFTTVSGDYYRTREVGDGAAAPLVVLSPILAGTVDDYRATRFFAERAASAGLSSFFLHQERVILDGERHAVDLEARIRQNLRATIQALDLFAARPEVDADALGSLGVSLGGIKNVILVAVEPRLRANVVLLAGADMPRILVTSRENLVERYLRARLHRDGLEPVEVAVEFSRFFSSRPSRLAEGVSNERVLLFLGRFDDKVPYPTGRLLREKLGCPETYLLPVGHYTAIAAAPWAAGVAAEWLRRRLAGGDAPPR